MSRLAKAVHRGADGSVHYLASSRDGSELIITDPVVGLSRINFDGPCRLVSGSPSLPASYDAVEYESITVSGSSSVSVRPGQPPFELDWWCWACMHGDHDFSVWPVCPRGDRKPVAGDVHLAEVEVPVRAPLQAVPEPEPERIPEPEPVPVEGMMPVPYVSGPGEGTNLADIDGPSWGPSNGSRGGPRFHRSRDSAP